MESAKMNIKLQGDVDVLKYKCISEFNEVIKKLNKGHRPKYQNILEKISIIELVTNNQLQNEQFIIQYFLNKV